MHSYLLIYNVHTGTTTTVVLGNHNGPKAKNMAEIAASRDYSVKAADVSWQPKVVANRRFYVAVKR